MKNFFHKINENVDKIQNILVQEIYVFHPLPCKLLDNFGLFIQVFLAISGFAVLIAKRALEDPRRSWKVWFMDVSKQGIAACTGHLINLMISEKFGKENMNQCNWYFISLITDVLIGTFLNIMVFKHLEIYLSDSKKYRFTSGEYGSDVLWSKWLYQCVIWLGIIYLVKIFLLLILFMNIEFFSFLSSWVLAPFQISPKIELVYVMVFSPTFLNAFAFWMTDSYLKKEDSEKEDSDSNGLIKSSEEKRLKKLMTI